MPSEHPARRRCYGFGIDVGASVLARAKGLKGWEALWSRRFAIPRLQGVSIPAILKAGRADVECLSRS